MSQLTVESVERLEEETMALLFEIYKRMCLLKELPPVIDVFYDEFKENWISDIHEFITVNADSWEVNVNEINSNNIREKIIELGFTIPGHRKIHSALNVYNISYLTSKGEIVNGPVIEVW